MLEQLQNYYLQKEEPNKSCLLALRNLILRQDTEITETQKYGMPCFCYRNRMFCYLWIDKKTNLPYILMVEGNLLGNPELEEGSRKRMKIFKVIPNEDLPIITIENIMQEALSLYKSGVIRIK